MGCWNATCGFSNLSIHHGDKVVGFILKPKNDLKPDMGGGYCYPNEMWDPIPVPFYGKYNDYGSMEDIISTKATKLVVKDLKFKDEKSLVDHAERDDETNSMGKYGLMLVHQDLFEYFIEIRSEKEIEDSLNAFITKNKNNQLWSPLSTLVRDYWDDDIPSIEDALEKNNKEVIKEVLKVRYCNYLLMELRKAWMPQIGAGSQGDNLELYAEMSAFIYQKIADHKEEYGEDL